MADGTEVAALFQLGDPATTEFHAFVGSFLRLSVRQREVLIDLIRQIIELEADGESEAVARLLAEAPALLRLSTRVN